MVRLAAFLVALPLLAGDPLSPGIHDLHREIVLSGEHDLTIDASHTTLRAAADFRGRALLVCFRCRNVTIDGLTLEGNRDVLGRPHGLPPSNLTFAAFEKNNGILILSGASVSLSHIKARQIAGYAVLVSHSSEVTLDSIAVEDSGSHNERGRNNATGGVLFEDGTTGFALRHSRFLRIRGNGVWTHSRLQSTRNANGHIEDNDFEEIGRDAVQIGHATKVEVVSNRGHRIGYPFSEIDVEGGAIPVAIDTAGNVDASLYARNVFREINGKCIDLDGFHHGTVESNSCVNASGADAYPNGHYGIVFNNNNPQMRSEAVIVRANVIEGFKYGGLFLLGSGHRIEGNRFLDINRAGCPESHVRYGCLYFPGQPDILSAGIYLGISAADWSRKEPAHDNTIVDNVITGHGMSTRCVVSAPGVPPEANQIARNRCSEQ
jgi:hypothetical protein